MAQADAKDRHGPEEFVDDGNLRPECRGVPRAVREEDPVGSQSVDVARARRRRHHRDAKALSQFAHHRFLNAVVEGHDVQVAVASNVGLFRRHAGDEVNAVGTFRAFRLSDNESRVAVTKSAW